MIEAPLRLLLIAGFLIASGIFDALAFTYSARMWHGAGLVWGETVKAGGSFIVGITMYWGAVRYLSEAGVVTAEMQTLVWFVVTILGVAVLGGRFFHWQLLEQLAAVNVFVSLGWLVSRSAA